MVSIIMAAFNSARFLSEAIDSVIAQSHEDWELIVINDCSVDDTAEIIRDYAAADPRILLLETISNQGAAAARNLGVQAARGDFIAFLDSDDIWIKNKLAVQMREMQMHRIPFSFTSYHVITEGGAWIRSIRAPRVVSYADLLKGCNVGFSTVVYNVEELGKCYFQLEPAIAREDYMMWLQLSKRSMYLPFMRGIDVPLVKYRKHDGGVSAKKRGVAMSQWRVYREVEKLPIFYSFYCFIHYAVNGVKKHYF